MSLFDHFGYRWRETYFLFHEVRRRPTTAQLEAVLEDLAQRIEIRDLKGDDAGYLEAVTLFAPNAYAAIDVSFAEGEEVLDQIASLQEELEGSLTDPEEIEKLHQLPSCNARLDLLHFEQILEGGEDDEDYSAAFDPGALLLVMEALSELCNGVGVDPASASVI